MPKKTRRILTILFLLFILFIFLYIFNIFNFKNALQGISVNTVTNGSTTITTTTGKSLKLPKEFLEHNISLLDGDNIISIIVSQTNQNNMHSTSTEAIITTQKNADEVFDHYIQKFSNPITTKTEKNAIIIGGNAENLIKLTIESEKYRIYMEQK